MTRIRDEVMRLSAENARLCAENARLLEENRSLRANAYRPPSLVEAFRDALGTTLGPGVNELLRDAQEQRAARMEAERKLAEFQEQLKKMTQAFQIPALTAGNPNDPQLPSARSGPRLPASEA